MIKYNLTCECKCTFDSWFANSQEFERLRRNNLIACIECSSNKLKKSIMAPSVSNLKKASNDDSKFKVLVSPIWRCTLPPSQGLYLMGRFA